jgi:hypothetical protein
MPKIVENGLKVDFHIHSVFSRGKDGLLVSNGTIENLPQLIDSLKANQVDMFAITDHDCFSFEMYQAAKKFENPNGIKKVFPGVEFSVEMAAEEGAKPIHVIAIFDDSSIDALKRLSQILLPSKPPYTNPQAKFFSEGGFLSVLHQINLNAVLIAHQKNSETSQHPQPQDLTSLGKHRFDELINIGFFDALEYRDQSQAVYHTLFKKTINHEDYERIRYLTGSDCHQWSVYPKEYDGCQSGDMEYTFLKCLPTFKGLVMSVTDDSRIGKSQDFFPAARRYQPSIDLNFGGEEVSIPLSKGINVVCGDNSIGKSLLLHRLTNYSHLDGTHGIPATRQTNYNSFLKANEITVKTSISDEDYLFDAQGEIRLHFEQGNFGTTFLVNKYPPDLSADDFKRIVQNALEPFYDALNDKFAYEATLSKLPLFFICGEPLTFSICSISKITTIYADSLKTPNIKRILSNINNLLTTSAVLKGLLRNESEKAKLEEFAQFLSTLKSNYEFVQKEETRKGEVIQGMNLGIEAFNQREAGLQSDKEQKYHAYTESRSSLCSSLCSLIVLKSKLKTFSFLGFQPVVLANASKAYGKVSLITRYACKKGKIDGDYLTGLVMSAFKKGSSFPDTQKITENDLTALISNADEEAGKVGLALLKSKIDSQISLDSASERAIVVNGEDCTKNYSAGFNATEYFDILSHDDSQLIYMVDQPEDDVSQTSIAHNVLPDLRHMRDMHQIILITHNPQFVVNLDADNVIFISKKAGRMVLQSGALEYQDDSYDILQLIEDNLDGGEESIRKRWKRYDKNNQTD